MRLSCPNCGSRVLEFIEIPTIVHKINKGRRAAGFRKDQLEPGKEFVDGLQCQDCHFKFKQPDE